MPARRVPRGLPSLFRTAGAALFLALLLLTLAGAGTRESAGEAAGDAAIDEVAPLALVAKEREAARPDGQGRSAGDQPDAPGLPEAPATPPRATREHAEARGGDEVAGTRRSVGGFAPRAPPQAG